MDRVLHLSGVDKANNGLNTSGYNDGWARRYAIVSDQGSRAQVGVNLLRELLNDNLIVPYVTSSNRVRDSPIEY
jgi:hypothetical protein